MQVAAERLAALVDLRLNEAAEENPWAEKFVAIVSGQDLDIKRKSEDILITVIPYQFAVSPEKIEFLKSQFPGGFISVWGREDFLKDKPATEAAIL